MPDAPPAKPATVLLWVAVQKLSRLRDEYTRAKCPVDRTAAAEAMVERADEIGRLVREVLAETVSYAPVRPAA